MLSDNGLSVLIVIGWQTPFILVLITLTRVARGRSPLRIKSDLSGTTLQADRTFGTLLLLAFATFIPVGIVYAICTLAGDLEMFRFARFAYRIAGPDSRCHRYRGRRFAVCLAPRRSRLRQRHPVWPRRRQHRVQ